MTRMRNALRKTDSGQALVEYALLTALIALAMIPVMAGLQQTMKTSYQNWNTSLAVLWSMPDSAGGP